MNNPYAQFLTPNTQTPSGPNPYSQFLNPGATPLNNATQANIDQMSTGERALVGLGHGFYNLAHGVGQAGLEVGNKLGLVSDNTLKNYNSNVNDQDAIFENLAKQSPAARMGDIGGEVIGTLPVGGAAGAVGKAGLAASRLLPEAVTSIPTLSSIGNGALSAAKWLAPGAAIGASQFTQDGDSRALNAAEGGVVGGVASEALGALSGGAKAVGRNLPFFSKTGQAAQKLAGAATRPNLSLTPAPVDGLPLTLGQSTNDPGLLALEKSLATKPSNVGGFIDQRTQANQAITGALHNLGADTPLEQSAIAMRQNIENAHANARSTERVLWDNIDPNNQTSISTAPLKNSVQDYINNLPKADRKLVPSDAVNTIINDLGDQEPLREFTALHSALQADVRSAYGSSNFNQARILGDIDKMVMGHLDNLPIQDQTALDAYNTAKGYSKYINQIYRQGPIKNILGVDATGADRVPETATGSKLIKSGPGASESLDSYLQAVNNDPQAIQDAQKYFMRSMLERAQQRTEDQQGNRVINAGALRNFYDKNQPLIGKLFNSDQQQQLGNIVQGAQMTARTMQAGLPGGSDTALKLAGRDYISNKLNSGLDSLFDLIPGASGRRAKIEDMVNAEVQRGLLDPQYGKKLLDSVTNVGGLIPASRPYISGATAASLPYGLLRPNN